MNKKRLIFYILNISFLGTACIIQSSDTPIALSGDTTIILKDRAKALLGIACFGQPYNGSIILNGEVKCSIKHANFRSSNRSDGTSTESSAATTADAAETYTIEAGETMIFGTLNPNSKITFQGTGSAIVGVVQLENKLEEFLQK